jgi:hypothetical protein
VQKYEIVNALIASNGYRRYLEICTPATGGRFSRIRGASLDWRHRLMYRCPPGFQDGSEITFRTSNESISHLLDPRMPYDIIFIDPYHSFDCSLRDLQSALAMLQPEGAVVVHDCCPVTRETSGPSFRSGSWFGLTYCAYIEFVLSRPDLVHYTVDTDCGCGVIKKASPRPAMPSNPAPTEVARLWHIEKNRQHDMFDFFQQHRDALLKLVSVEDFLFRERLKPSRLSRLNQCREQLASLWHVWQLLT